MKLTLDETLGDSNPHYSRVLREKMAAREAAQAAMEARKAALVEASWCKILRAARIQCKEAEALLVKAEKTAAEAFEAATALGVIMYDTPNCPRKPSKIETSTVDGGRCTTHTVTASFETAFDADKEVAAAVKTAFVRLSSCPSFDKDEFKELLCKISQNPDMGENNNNQEVSEFSSESGSEVETMSQNESFSAKDVSCKLPTMDSRLKKTKRRQSLGKLNTENLVDMMLDRLRCLKEDELSSLATIVATCGLNAALAEEESSNVPRRMSNIPRRISSAGAGSMRYSNLEQMRRKQVESELPSLDKFLVKHMTKLEREVQEAKNSRRNGSIEGNVENTDEIDSGTVNLDNNSSHESIPDLGSILVKHSSKLKKEIEEAKKNSRKSFEIPCKKAISQRKEDVQEVPSLDKFLVKHVSRLEKEVQEAKSTRKNDLVVEESNLMNVNKTVNSSTSVSESQKNTTSYIGEAAEKENVDMNKEEEDSLDKILVKPLSLRNSHRNHKHQRGDNAADYEGLDKVLVKQVSRLEKEKMEFSLKEEEEMKKFKTSSRNVDMQEMNEQGSLDQIFVKHKSRLEREKKMAASQKPGDQIRLSVSRREARERELQETWGGLSLGNSIKPHISKLEKDKAAWIKAAEEETRPAAIKDQNSF